MMPKYPEYMLHKVVNVILKMKTMGAYCQMVASFTLIFILLLEDIVWVCSQV